MLIYDIIDAFEGSAFNTHQDLADEAELNVQTVRRAFRTMGARESTLTKLANVLGVATNNSTGDQELMMFRKAELAGMRYEVRVGKYTALVGIEDPLSGRFMVRTTKSQSATGWKQAAVARAAELNKRI